jgi:hypothetical protein
MTNGGRNLKSRTCAVCRHPERARIEALRASGASLDSLARKFKVHRDAVWRHWQSHCSPDLKIQYLAGPATIAELKERAAKEDGAVIDYLTTLRSILMGAITANAEAGSATTLANLSGRLVEVLREIGRITGEIERLNPGVNVTTNIAIMSDPRIIELQSGLLTIARTHPAARGDIIALLRGLDAGPVGGLLAPAGGNGAAAPGMALAGLPGPAGVPVIEGEVINAA